MTDSTDDVYIENISNSSHGKIIHSEAIDYVASVIGWIYFSAWTLSFYPQVISNWRRKSLTLQQIVEPVIFEELSNLRTHNNNSLLNICFAKSREFFIQKKPIDWALFFLSVVGLSFDFVLFNITGFVAYSCFNVGFYWIPAVRDEYFKDHLDGVSPVQINDVIFAIHAVLITLVVVGQCFIYERGSQKISLWSKLFLVLVFLYVLISLILTLAHVMTWLTFLYNFSYIKLVVTCLKYTPQAVLNFQRKSTVGWSIGNVLLDFIGGWLSILQMFLLAYNGDDWESIFGNVTKFGLGVVTIFFDSIFIIQHYFLYRGKEPYESLKGNEIPYEALKGTEIQIDPLKTKDIFPSLVPKDGKDMPSLQSGQSGL